MPEGTVLTVAFELNGTEFVALNGGPEFRFNPAVSFAVNCADQGEIDYYWERLSEGGQPNVCGWLTDRYGLSWQIVPENIGKLVASQAGFDAMMKMTKIDIGELERASKGASV
jgi:predicted 3-demethylubiquinone-9 3-methyltransferase (glyoxalase superfamily)